MEDFEKGKETGLGSFLFMRSSGQQLGELTKLIEAGIILPVMDQVFPLSEINEAMSYIESGRAKG
ncbi:zinc-binding dehydrogenase [Algoriphagus aestuariicola]|nr:zinc-binding dehydrogenase [Algoriphagus aestuariicola]